MRRQVTIDEINNMTPEELKEFQREASRAIILRFGTLFLIKLLTALILRQLVKRLEK
jgi:hypothetical protein